MCIVYKMNVVVTRLPLEAARSEVDIYAISWIILNGNQSQRKIPFLLILIDRGVNEILYNL